MDYGPLGLSWELVLAVAFSGLILMTLCAAVELCWFSSTMIVESRRRRGRVLHILNCWLAIPGILMVLASLIVVTVAVAIHRNPF